MPAPPSSIKNIRHKAHLFFPLVAGTHCTARLCTMSSALPYEISYDSSLPF